MGNCQDINECTDGTHDCDANASCSNTAGSFTCQCNAGYEGSGKACQDINECNNSALNDCDPNALCTNTAGSFTCACNAGYSGNGKSCADVNECSSGTHDC